ncbi:MAG: 30S ribosomal protein S16 [Phycisphaerae bacterium]
MVKLRLKRIGRRHRPSYRLAAVDSRRARDSKVIEELGQYDPVNQNVEQQVNFQKERIEYWLGVGAQPSDTVRRILIHQGILEEKKKKN